MNGKTGWRKVIIYTESLIAFCLVSITLNLIEANVIIALGLAIGGLLGAAIYGNVKEHQSKSLDDNGASQGGAST